MNNEIFSIGYYSFSIQDFVNIIKKNTIGVVADVRSQPYSRFKPEFNRENLKQILNQNDIEYVFLGEQCGARVKAPECYVNGKVSFDLVRHNQDFQNGLQLLRNGIHLHRIAIMCAEKDPINCHRAILICKNLRSPDITIKHIIDNHLTENHTQTERRLMALHGLDKELLYTSDSERLEEAYRLQSEEIAYHESNLNLKKHRKERAIG